MFEKLNLSEEKWLNFFVCLRDADLFSSSDMSSFLCAKLTFYKCHTIVLLAQEFSQVCCICISVSFNLDITTSN